MKTIAVLDYFMNKNFNVIDIPDDVEIHHWDKIAYFLEEKWTQKESIGTAIWYPLDLDRSIPFSRKLSTEECEEFARYIKCGELRNVHYEDMDYSLRVLDAGFKIFYEKDAIVYHKVGKSAGRGSKLNIYYNVRNRFYIIHKFGIL